MAKFMLYFLGGYAISGAVLFLNLFLLSPTLLFPFVFLPFSYECSKISNSPPPNRPVFLYPSPKSPTPRNTLFKFISPKHLIFTAFIILDYTSLPFSLSHLSPSPSPSPLSNLVSLLKVTFASFFLLEKDSGIINTLLFIFSCKMRIWM